DTGPLPASGGDLSSSVAAIDLPGLLTAGVGQGSASGQGNHSRSSASLTDVALTVLGISITATAVQSQAEARCQAGQPQVSGSSGHKLTRPAVPDGRPRSVQDALGL